MPQRGLLGYAIETFGSYVGMIGVDGIFGGSAEEQSSKDRKPGQESLA